ncbi:MAG TPA: DUF4010 domain-containing protein [Ktedonobacteraceae bacterium]|nr:DUF4010 domain-containing protein [Ktedonobacteraceae bacterium]
MDTPLLLAEKIVASASVGLVIGLEREWAHKEAGVRSFAIAALLGTIAWLASPTVALIEVGIVALVILVVNLFSLQKEQPLEVTTSLALAATNVLGILIGIGAFFLAFTCAILITALLSWKTEIVSFTSKLTVREIRSALLLAFVAAVVYPLLPGSPVDPWKLVNPRGVWLTVILVSALSFVNYILLRQLGSRGMRYSAILGGLVNSAATSALLGEELKNDAGIVRTTASNFLLADMAMILRNGVLVAIFAAPRGIQGSFATVIILGAMMLAAIILAIIIFLQSQKKPQQAPQKPPLSSPLSLRSVLYFGLLFLALTVVSGLGQRFFGAVGFLAVVVIGALASAAASAVLVGGQIHLIGANVAALAMFFATLVGLVENVVIFYIVTRDRGTSLRLALLTLPIILVGGMALALILWLG